MEKPTFICIPSLSHSPFIFDRLKTALQSHGYPMIPLALPSIGGRPPTYDFTEDVRAIRSLASQLVEAGKELIIVMHGYAGIPGGEALLGLGKPEREMAGLQGGVTRLVFIMAWLCKEGFQGSPRGDITDMYPWVTCNLEVSSSPISPGAFPHLTFSQTGILTINPAQATSVFYNDMQRHEAEYWASQLLPQSIGVFWSKTTYAAWRFIPSTYVICGRDQSRQLSLPPSHPSTRPTTHLPPFHTYRPNPFSNTH